MPRRLTFEEFVDRARLKFGDKFGYSNFIYVSIKVKSIIDCPFHGELLQAPDSHLNSVTGCPYCGNELISAKNRLTFEYFLLKAREIHGDKYQYSDEGYENTDSEITIICPRHGPFTQLATNHIHGRGAGCRQCKNKKAGDRLRSSTDEFIRKSKLKHGDRYGYSKAIYIDNKTPVVIICETHKEFEQLPSVHLRGAGCQRCYEAKRGRTRLKSVEDFIAKARLIHGDKYGYDDLVYKKRKAIVKINCPRHGDFLQQAGKHLSGQGCPICSESQGERNVSLVLERLNLSYEREKFFTDCRDAYVLPFDFYLPERNLLIEFWGVQHTERVVHFHTPEEFEKLKLHDNIKATWAKNNGVNLIIIPYTKKTYDAVEDYLKGYLS